MFRIHCHMFHQSYDDPITMTYDTPRQKALDEASEIVHKDRNVNYGNPEDNFRDIAALWSTFKGVTFTPMDVAVMNMLIKVARLKKNPQHHDSVIDIIGYGACAADIQAWVARIEKGLETGAVLSR